MSPVSFAPVVSDKPAGNVPGLMLHVYGLTPPDAEHDTETGVPTVGGSVAGVQTTVSCAHAAPAASTASAIDLAIMRVIGVDRSPECRE
jgi:hypothetical protein